MDSYYFDMGYEAGKNGKMLAEYKDYFRKKEDYAQFLQGFLKAQLDKSTSRS